MQLSLPASFETSWIHMKKTLKTLVKFVVVGVLFYFLSRNGSISIEHTRNALKRIDRVAFSLFLGLVCAMLGVLRWHLLLRAQNIHLSFARVFQLTFVGNFFNIALPGAVSGDFVKAFYVAKESKGRPSLAFGSILLDRIVGLSALVFVSATALAIGFRQFEVGHIFDALGMFLKLAAIAVVAFYGYLFLVKESHDPILRFLSVVESKVKPASSVRRIYESIRGYHSRRRAVLSALFISLVIHVLVGVQLVNFLGALDESAVTPLQLYAVFPMGLLVTAVPVAPAGIGTGHAAFAYLLKLFGSARGADLFSLFAMVQLFTGAIGGLVYLQFRSHHPDIQSAMKAPSTDQTSS